MCNRWPARVKLLSSANGVEDLEPPVDHGAAAAGGRQGTRTAELPAADRGRSRAIMRRGARLRCDFEAAGCDGENIGHRS